MKRVILLILDSVGCGTCPDSHRYNDEGANTLNHIAQQVPSIALPNLLRLGLGRIPDLPALEAIHPAAGAFGRLQERSPGKDTTTGHWELAGIRLSHPFPTYPDGFPEELIQSFEQAIGTRTLGNIASSGTEIIEKLGDAHVATGYPIVYTSEIGRAHV